MLGLHPHILDNMLASPLIFIIALRSSSHSSMLSGSCLFLPALGFWELALVLLDRCDWVSGFAFLFLAMLVFGAFLALFSFLRSLKFYRFFWAYINVTRFVSWKRCSFWYFTSPPCPSRAFSVRAQVLLILALFFFLFPLFWFLVARSTSCPGCHA